MRQNQLLSLDDLKFQIHVLDSRLNSELLPKVLLYWSQFFANLRTKNAKYKEIFQNAPLMLLHLSVTVTLSRLNKILNDWKVVQKRNHTVELGRIRQYINWYLFWLFERVFHCYDRFIKRLHSWSLPTI